MGVACPKDVTAEGRSTTGVADRATKRTTSRTKSAMATKMSFLTSQCSPNKPSYRKDVISNQIPAFLPRVPGSVLTNESERVAQSQKHVIAVLIKRPARSLRTEKRNALADFGVDLAARDHVGPWERKRGCESCSCFCQRTPGGLVVGEIQEDLDIPSENMSAYLVL